jgi:hypothetical protein
MEENLIKMCFNYFGTLSDEDILSVLIEFYESYTGKTIIEDVYLRKSTPHITGLSGSDSFGYHLMFNETTYVNLGFFEDGTVNHDGYQDGYYLELYLYNDYLSTSIYQFVDPTILVAILRKYKLNDIN